ncbi:CSL zinc finger-domain-containing protein [Neohortaea acidophila]|uniref:Diphthamide biosynthesis protein 4 n=1 Tax=Neohortaea acidophila TaxID=245834 RepID=A0A6A6PM43_9PEZI|nr:CSL zinc finger-domain-containing protein [Neohortaea acidophila]KAF2480975.1 CSL zinc finger-domain-containing protein [Neohortaea acidophila]
MEARDDYYRLLGLSSSPDTTLSPLELKAAYRRSLLQYHPDKADKNQSAEEPLPITVDDIALAYKTLSDPELKAEYDRRLRTAHLTDGTGELASANLHTGLETVDLDDLGFDAEHQVWKRSCRCGDENGFQVSEADLEQNVEDGEVFVGCSGCSLWLRVLFSAEA